jgi:hypothetical protein
LHSPAEICERINFNRSDAEGAEGLIDFLDTLSIAEISATSVARWAGGTGLSHLS